mmetsp:Transcript_8673/g.30309  ORF Transcript_8673/g.30309 Transcript_8673/m.30309 type:complete len:376 (+) Transcript_8673:117-1244(+)
MLEKRLAAIYATHSCLKAFALLARHFLEIYLQQTARGLKLYFNCYAQVFCGYMWKPGNRFPTYVGCHFLKKVEFWTHMTYAVCSEKTAFFSHDKHSQKQFAENLGINTAHTIDSIEMKDFQSTSLKLPRQDFVLKCQVATNKTVVFIKHGTAELVNNQVFHVPSLQQQNTRLKASFIAEELLLNDAGNPCPPTYKIFVLGTRILKIFCFPSRISNKHEHAFCVDLEHNASESNWLVHKAGARNKCLQSNDRPRCWDELLHAAGKIGKALDRFALLYFYATDAGAVFGGMRNRFDTNTWSTECSQELQCMYDSLSKPSDMDRVLPNPFIPRRALVDSHHGTLLSQSLNNHRKPLISDIRVLLCFFICAGLWQLQSK